MHPIEHREPIRQFRFGERRAELAFIIIFIIDVVAVISIVRFTRVGAANLNAGDFYTGDLSSVCV